MPVQLYKSSARYRHIGPIAFLQTVTSVFVHFGSCVVQSKESKCPMTEVPKDRSDWIQYSELLLIFDIDTSDIADRKITAGNRIGRTRRYWKENL